MPLEPLPFDRKGLLKDRKQSSSDSVEIALARCRELPTTPSQHNNYGPSPFCRWGGGGGPSDIRRPFSGHQGKRVACGWRRVESGSKENNSNASGVSMDFGCQKDSASPNGNSHPHSVFMNSSDQHQSNDQYAKNSGDGVNSHKRLEKENSLGSSLEWKPRKWGRGCGFINSSNCKSHDTKIEAQLGDNTPFGDAVSCVTPRTFDEARSRKKQRLGWGEGLAKYEKKKVDPDDKEAGATHDDVTEPSLPSPCNLSDKSPSLTGFSEYASPTTPYSFACSSSPGVEEKEPIKEVNDTCNPSVVSENHTAGLAFNLENLEVSEDFNMSSSLDELLQTGDSTSPRSGFAMDKLLVWKAHISKKLEITETEIDSLENKLKFISDAFISFPTKCNNEILEETCGGEKTDSSPEGHSGDEDLDGKSSPDMSTSEFVEPPLNNGDIRSEKAKCSEDLVSDDDMLGGESHSCTVSVGGDVHYGREDKLYDSILSTNRVLANTASDELTRLLPTTAHLCTNISETTNDSQIKKKIAMRNRFLKFKERAITLKFRALHYSWKEDLHLLSAKRSGSKSHKKSESSSRGSLSTTGTLDYANKLLSDSRVRVYRNELKMPCLILDRRERMSTRFISDNGLVESPIDVEKERSVLNPWTEKEKEVFLDKYSLFGKDFKKIASFLEHKTIADCVEFYYKNHKSDCFQNAKKKSEFAKRKSCSANTFMVMSGRRSNYETGPTSLEMLGAASAMVEKSDNEQETAAADVLAGICGSISPEALGSCITSSGDVHVRKFDSCSKRQPDADEDTCSDDSCGEDMDLSVWTDEEKASFIKGVRLYGRDFVMISQCVRTRSSDQCRVYFSKARKCLGLDVIEDGSEGGGGTDPEEDKSSCLEEIKVEEAADSENTYSEGSAGEINDDFYALGTKVEADTVPSVSAKEGITESEHGLNGVRDSGSDLNYGSEKVASEKSGDGFLMSNLFSSVGRAVKQENASTRLSFRKSCDKMYQRCSSSSSFLDCVSETKSNFKLDKSLFMPRDLKSVSEEQSSSSCGDVKLFGQILTKKPRESGEMSSKLNFDGRKVDVDQSLTVKNNISYGFWDGKRIQTGFSYLPDSARLLAKYPAAFSNMSTTSFKFDKQLHYQQQKLNGFCVDKLLLPENVVGDPIRMQYAKREECKKNGEGWR